MEREQLFTQKLRETVRLARTQRNKLTAGQVEALLAELAIEEEKKQAVYEYLGRNRIRIGEDEEEEELPEEDRQYLEVYLEEIRQFTLTEEEKKNLFQRVVAEEEGAQAELVKRFLPEVAAIAKLYAGQGVLLEDLIGEGNVALTFGVMLLILTESAEEAESMLVKTLMNSMEDYINRDLKLSEADQRIADIINQIAESAGELEEELGRKVTIEELVRETDFTEEQIREAIDITANHLESIEDIRDGNESEQ